MGTCLSKDNRRQRDDDSLSRVSQNTIFRAEDPFSYMSELLAKPPQLSALIQIKSLDQKSHRARESLAKVEDQKKNMEEFLKNDSVSVYMGSRVNSEPKQTDQKMTADLKIKMEDKSRHIQNKQECQVQEEVSLKAFGKYSVDLGANLQSNLMPGVVSKSAIIAS